MDTPDGTAIRDDVHVTDLADAHLRVMDRLGREASLRYNIGSGTGHSVREVVAAVERASGRPVPVREGPRRPGDPPVLVASHARIRRETGWEPRHGTLESIVRTALAWRHSPPRRLPARRATAGGRQEGPGPARRPEAEQVRHLRRGRPPGGTGIRLDAVVRDRPAG